MDISQFLGRLHPLVLHLPIGILMLAFVMAWLGRQKQYLAQAAEFALLIGVGTSIVAAISGYVLSLEGGYHEETLWQHQWLGISTVVLSVIVYLLARSRQSANGKKLYLPIFGGLLLVLGVTGHLGGSLTHGSDFLSEPFTGSKESGASVIRNMDSAMVFQDLIQPIFKQKCVSCHNESKIKGELLMTTIEGIQQGGKTGPMFVSENVKNSLFLKRAHLPLEAKKHMPPKGKKQLSEDELTLLSWWVEQGATFDRRVGDLDKSESIQTILAKYVEPDHSVFALVVEPIDEATIQKIRKANIPIARIAENKPFVKVSLRNRRDLSKKTFKELKGISEQLIELDLSNTNMNDQLFGYLEYFPHLQKLFLQQTKITGKDLDLLADMKYLEYLNVYDTPIKDEAIKKVRGIASLQNLYLWRTNVSPRAIEALQSQRPRLHINTGIDKDIFGDAQLKAPLINVDKDIFKDSVRVAFEINFKNVDLFYTLDGTVPDTLSRKYSDPILVTETSQIQVIAHKSGWKTSDVAQKTIVKAAYQVKNISLDKKPADQYKAEGPSSLIDFKKGTLSFSEGRWLGYAKQHFTATLDMGVITDLSGITVSALESTGAYIFFPKNLEVQISKNGKQYQTIAQKAIPTTPGPTPPESRNFVLKFDTQKARYVKVLVKSNLTNPAWHPTPGAPCWVFVDEIMVE